MKSVSEIGSVNLSKIVKLAWLGTILKEIMKYRMHLFFKATTKLSSVARDDFSPQFRLTLEVFKQQTVEELIHIIYKSICSDKHPDL